MIKVISRIIVEFRVSQELKITSQLADSLLRCHCLMATVRFVLLHAIHSAPCLVDAAVP